MIHKGSEWEEYDASGKLLLAQCRKCEKKGEAAIFRPRGCALHYSSKHHSHRLGWEHFQNRASWLPCKKGGWEECRTLKTKHAKGSANNLRVWKPSKESDLIRLAVWKGCTACRLENRPRENQPGSCPNKAGIHWDWPEARPWRELPRWYSGEESTCQRRRCWFDPWVRKIPWRRKWQPTPVFLPGKFHGQRSLVGYSPRGHKESDTTEHEQKDWWSE